MQIPSPLPPGSDLEETTEVEIAGPAGRARGAALVLTLAALAPFTPPFRGPPSRRRPARRFFEPSCIDRRVEGVQETGYVRVVGVRDVGGMPVPFDGGHVRRRLDPALHQIPAVWQGMGNVAAEYRPRDLAGEDEG